MVIRLVFVFLALLSVSAAESFDKPKYKKTVNLGPSPAGFGRRAKVNCYFYSTFMVKEVDLGEKGAARLSIVPITLGVVSRCTRTRSKNEKVINPDEWTGYFKGVKNDLVFFDADDGWNGGLGFAVYDPHTRKKIFEDVALGSLEFSSGSDHELSMKYTRVIDSGCNAVKDQESCWAQIQKTASLQNASMPDCKKGYEKSAQDLAKGRCQAQNTDTPQCLDKEILLARDQTYNAASAIAYPVEVVLGSPPTIKPIPGELQCWPVD